MKFYEVVQGGHIVGRFLHYHNAINYSKEFNTRVFVSPVKIIERELQDDTNNSDSDWSTEYDTTSETGGV